MKEKVNSNEDKMEVESGLSEGSNKINVGYNNEDNDVSDGDENLSGITSSSSSDEND